VPTRVHNPDNKGGSWNFVLCALETKQPLTSGFPNILQLCVRFMVAILDKKLISKRDSRERELLLRRYRTRTSKYNPLLNIQHDAGLRGTASGVAPPVGVAAWHYFAPLLPRPYLKVTK